MIKNFIIAILIVAISEFISLILSKQSIVISSAIICILFGLIINQFKIINLNNINQILTRNFLKIGVALIGIQLSIYEFYSYGSISILIIIINFLLIFLSLKIIYLFYNSEKSLLNLLAIGSSVCGITAIMASIAIIKNNKKEISCAVAVITLVGTLSVFISPYFSHLIFEQNHIRSGIFLGTTIHDTSQVVAAGKIYQNSFNSLEAFNASISTKLIRNSFLIILIPLLAFSYAFKTRKAYRANFFNLLPPFIIIFIFLAIFRSLGDTYFPITIWQQLIEIASVISKYFILLALFGLGSNISFQDLKAFGLKPFIIGFCFSMILICSTIIYLKLI